MTQPPERQGPDIRPPRLTPQDVSEMPTIPLRPGERRKQTPPVSSETQTGRLRALRDLVGTVGDAVRSIEEMLTKEGRHPRLERLLRDLHNKEE